MRRVREQLGAALSEFENGVTARLLGGTPLAGATREGWAASRASVAALWRLLAAVEGAGAAENDPFAPPVDVPPTSGTPLAKSERLPLAEALDRIQREHDAVAGFLARVEQAWNGGFPALQSAEQAADRADGIAERELGGADLGRAAFRAEYERTAELLRSDPIAAAGLDAGAGPHPVAAQSEAAGAHRDGPIAALARAADALTDRVRGAAALRSGFAERRAQLADAAATAEDALLRAEQTRRHTAARIADPGPAAPPPEPLSASSPTELLDTVDAVYRAAEWEALPATVAAAEEGVRAATAHAAQLSRSSRAALARRDELRGQLDAYSARLARVGRAEEGGLARLQQEARALLWTAPCDLAAAADAVERFRRALAEPPTIGLQQPFEASRADQGRPGGPGGPGGSGPSGPGPSGPHDVCGTCGSHGKEVGG